MGLVDRNDLKVEWLPTRAPGGQHAGPDRGMVKVTHLPTETVAIVKDQRSQFANREAAMRMIEFYLTDPENR